MNRFQIEIPVHFLLEENMSILVYRPDFWYLLMGNFLVDVTVIFESIAFPEKVNSIQFGGGKA